MLKPRAALEQRTPPPAPTQQRPPLPPREPPEPHRSALYVPWWGLVIVILAVAAITCGMWWVVFSSRGAGADAGAASPTPIFMVITATPTLEGAGGGQPTGEMQPTVPPSPTVEEQPTATPTASPAAPLAVGSRVAIAGTEGFGLRVRQGPGLGFDMIFLAYDGEEFTVEDGPREVDGFVWWYIVDPDDPNRFGWAAEEFMQVVP